MFQVEKGRLWISHKFCEAKGLRVTPQRIAIYDALRGHHNHPTAEMIYHSLRPTHPSMSLATVYKTMEIFEKLALLKC